MLIFVKKIDDTSIRCSFCNLQRAQTLCYDSTSCLTAIAAKKTCSRQSHQYTYLNSYCDCSFKDREHDYRCGYDQEETEDEYSDYHRIFYFCDDRCLNMYILQNPNL